MTDFIPLLAFGGAYYFYDIYVATAVLIVAMSVAVIWQWLRHRKISRVLLASYLMVLLFGGLSLMLRDTTFLKIKPTIFNWVLGLILIGGELIGKRNLLSSLVAGFNPKFQLPATIWRRLSYGWAIGMFLKGGLNLYFAYSYSEAIWVTFKLFGQFALSVLFIILTLFYLRDFLTTDADNETS